ncbi:MAG TPA: DUF262 domain-containing HNH endonuclease family protein [Vitreimonas sp.]|uniref:DUF262 domain-containing protein n=1 Tax=Vitreimonas sp. TaxID=3069702 RepID=UPI002D611A1A|nr:DUF262 domain-containing HNH endonuclease family protein [Vitreimonas sp.]HYD86331.1 DUF262 domain-containing HNH endonuclease family protein [Vitreimonas sp.]
MAGAFGNTPLGLSSQILNLGGVLTRKPDLKVPRYQRPYTWTDSEVRELIQDLRAAHDRKAPFYFIGQIVLVKNKGKFEISDGQQRLATLTMLFAYARDRMPARAKPYQTLILDGDAPRLLLRDEDANYFRGMVQEPGQMKALARAQETGNESKDLFALAAHTIETEMAKIEDDRELDGFMSYVARCCTLNVVDADERGCAQTVFHTLNKRGSPLSSADIIKSDLIENSKLSSAEAEAAARKWEEMEALFEREDFAKLLYMMPFLLTGEAIRSPGDLASFRTAIDNAGGVYNFLFEQLPRYALALRSIFAGSINVGPASVEVNRRVALMKQVEKWDWAPAAIAFLAEHSHEPERARKFFQALDRFTFACELAVIDNRVREKRYALAVKKCGDDRALYTEGGLLLSEAENDKFIFNLNRSRPRDRQRRLLMMRLEAAMPGGHLLTMTDDVTVEHVLPKSGGGWWNEHFPDKKLREELTNLLGNLVLITYEQNKDADTKPYPKKREIFFERPNAPVHAVTEDIHQIPDWTFQAIEMRHERLVRILCEDWGLIRGG